MLVRHGSVQSVEQTIGNTSKGRFMMFCRSTYEHDSLRGRATWLGGFSSQLPFGRIGRVVCVARSNAYAIEWPQEFRQQSVVSA